ncbi:MAG: hypothetical protein PHN56_05640 [Candidatus Nanoarchaeia archaeon]|nr:hypothetical protein [Candidatus Nanoarchaeia archaeon]
MNNIIIEYDGPISDNNIRAQSIISKIFDKIEKEYCLNREFIINNFNKTKKIIIKNDAEFPYLINNEISCYCEDELVLNRVSLNKSFYNNGYTYFRKFEERNPDYFLDFYKESELVFSKGIEEFFKNNKYENINIVSNLPESIIKKELENYRLHVNIFGNAQKNFIKFNSRFNKSQLSIGKRMINLNRPFYEKFLSNFNPKDSIAVSDNFSRDLTLPLTLGFDVALIKNDYNVWAQKYMNLIGKRVIENLSEL